MKTQNFILIAAILLTGLHLTTAQITTSEIKTEDTGGTTWIDGDLGIGTTPYRDVHLKKSNIGGQVRLQVENSDNSNPASHGVVSVYSGGSNSGDSFLHLHPGTASGEWTVGVDNSNDDKFKIGSSFSVGTATALTIEHNLDIGIGTTNPYRDVHLKKSNIGGQVRLQVENSDNSNPASHGVVSVYSGGSNSGDSFLHLHPGTASGEWTVGVDNSNDDKFKIGSSFSIGTATALTINHNLDIGIGTTNPNYKLDVNGSLNAHSLYNSGVLRWSDFVFKEEYKLPSLIEVEQHIKKFGHLQHIPSEKEVLENGYDIGTMDARLLQKIEELTLYTIQQQKEIEAMKEEIDKLKPQKK